MVQNLNGPPRWRRSRDAPSNIHDNAYAFGTVDFTGDMPVILGPDGLSGRLCLSGNCHALIYGKLVSWQQGTPLEFIAVTTESAVSELMLGHEEATNLRALAGGTVAVADYLRVLNPFFLTD